MKVLFAPDWRDGNPYQALLADALGRQGVDVQFIRGYRLLFPLSRELPRYDVDLVHLHWPEAYFPRQGDHWDIFRSLRYSPDLMFSTMSKPLITTAHNLLPHGRTTERIARFNQKFSYNHSRAVIAHTRGSARQIHDIFGVESEKIHVIPHGDLSTTLGEPFSRDEARRRLAVGETPIALMFGAVAEYKGIEAVIDYWIKNKPAARLVVIGKPVTPEYGEQLQKRAAGHASIDLRLTWQSDEDLRLWLSAADCVIFNYQTILTSGGATLVRSWGVPMLISSRLNTVDLDEPHRSVIRFDNFDSDFDQRLKQALTTGSSYESAADWRLATNWDTVARSTAHIYRSVLGIRNDSTDGASAADAETGPGR